MLLNSSLMWRTKTLSLFLILVCIYTSATACDSPNHEDNTNDIKSHLLPNYELNISLTNRNTADIEIMHSTFSANYIRYSFRRNGKEIKLFGVAPMYNHVELFTTLDKGDTHNRNIKLLKRFRGLKEELKKGDIKLTWVARVSFRSMSSASNEKSLNSYDFTQSVNLPSL